MAKEAFDKIMGGLHEVQAYMDGERKGFAVHEPLDIKAIRARAEMSQAKFARTYRLPLGTLKDWEQGRRQPDAPARALLTIIERNPGAAAEALAEA
ncbi:MAG: transcriptional regulator [Pseudomonadota bacterium]|jgi:putative transcriptional regulator|nr:transcriptional regulator [Pseudomonadota bacterium]